jgi:putrescine aminotransferase
MAAATAKTALRNTTTHWQAVDREHHIHPFTDQKELAQQGSRVITKAEGT